VIVSKYITCVAGTDRLIGFIVRSILPLEALPNMLSFVAGKPNPDLFPISKMSLALKGHGYSTVEIEAEDMQKALQYGDAEGDPDLIKVFFYMPSLSRIKFVCMVIQAR
jgi:hypothetical protein